jgi:hypothetical protein
MRFPVIPGRDPGISLDPGGCTDPPIKSGDDGHPSSESRSLRGPGGI